jgi:hypothetical protein
MVETLEYTSETDYKPVYKKPDDDFRRAITMEEFFHLVREDLKEIFKDEKKTA